MLNHRHMPFQGVVRNLLYCKDSNQSIVSESVESIALTFAGIPGDTHSGQTRKACTRFPYLYKEGTEISNSRQISIISTVELQDIADEMEIEDIPPGWLGANLEIDGIPNLTLLPPSTRLVFSNKATLVVDLENRPCVYPAQIIDRHYAGKGRKFIKKALHKRGVTAWVEREGSLQPGDTVDVFFPDQPLHPLQN
ncbi:MAG: MOSC domain-containing protein [Gammaproteobacteria bacterium]|nr:MOSC domain-containing protein [Gammaproteobacteria bacterium]